MASYSGRGIHGSTVESIGARIVAGSMKPGEVLDLDALGAELDVSKTALREALKVLTSKGLVDARQRKGTFVRRRETWNVLDSDVILWHRQAEQARAVLTDLSEMRTIVEPGAAALAALRRTDEDIAALEDALTSMREAVGADAETATAADLRWHRALLRATHNEMLARVEHIIEPGLLLRDSLVHDHGADDPVPSHEAVTEAVRDGDSDRAAQAAFDLLHKASEDLSAALDSVTNREGHTA